MDYTSYYHELLADIRKARETWTFDQSAFLATACEMLKDCSAIVDFEPSYLREREGTKAAMTIDGYDQAAFDQDNSIVIFACDDGVTDRLNDEPERVPTVIGRECNRYLTGMRNFIKGACSGNFMKNHEESRPEYGLAAFIHENRDQITRYRLYFLTDRLYTGRESSIDGAKTATSDVYSGDSSEGVNVEAHVWDLSRFHDAARAAAPQEQLSIDLTQYVPGGIQAIKAPGGSEDFTTYLMFFTGDVLADLYEKYGAKLMEANVRSFLSARGKVNKGIRNTLRTRPDHFVAFNNGITATTTGMKLTPNGVGATGSFLVERFDNLQIVNGGQTTASIFYTGKQDKVRFGNVVVPAKVVLVENEDVSNDLIPDISRFTNSQNKVAEADLSSNSDFQRRLDELSQQVLSPPQPGVHYQTRWYYERARGQYESEKNRFSGKAKTMFSKTNPKDQIIKKVDVAKYQLSWDRRPNDVSLGGEKCFAVFAGQMSDMAENGIEDIDRDYYRQIVAKKILFDTARNHFMTKSTWYRHAYLANITTYAVSKIAEDCRKAGKTLDFRRIWQEQSIPEDFIGTIDEAGRQANEVLTDEERPTQNVTEWAKKKACWQRLQDYPTCLGESVVIVDNNVKGPRHVARRNGTPSSASPAAGSTVGTDVPHAAARRETPIQRSMASLGASRQVAHERLDAPNLSETTEDENLQWMLSVPKEQWSQLYDFADGHNMLSPTTEKSLMQLMSPFRNDGIGNLIKVKPMLFLINRAAKQGFIIQGREK